MVILLAVILQLTLPLLVWRWLRRHGWSKRIVLLAALPIPAIGLARGVYLFATVERLSNGELASVREEYRLTAAVLFAVAAVVLYLLGFGIAWISGGEPSTKPRADKLEDVFE